MIATGTKINLTNQNGV